MMMFGVLGRQSKLGRERGRDRSLGNISRAVGQWNRDGKAANKRGHHYG